MVTIRTPRRLSASRHKPARMTTGSSPAPATPATPAAYLPLLRTGRWFAALPDDCAQALVDMAQLRTLAPGAPLFLRGDLPCGLYAVLRGAVDISGAGGPRDAARAALLTRLEAPAWFGEIALFDNAARTHDAHAAEATLLLQVPHERLQAWLATHPQHWRTLALLLTDKLRSAFVALEDQALLPAPQRLARRLVLMAEGYGQLRQERASRRVISLSQEQLSLMLAISRQTINQILRDLQTRGLVRVQRGEVEIIDLPALRAICY